MTASEPAEPSSAALVQPDPPPARRAMPRVSRDLPVRNAEPFWPAQLTAAAALVLYLTLPHSLIMGPKWLVPGIEGVLLLGLVITTPTRHHNQSRRLRALIVGLVGLVSLTTLISLILLARFLLDGSRAGGHALLFARPTRTRPRSAPRTRCRSARRGSC